MTRFEIRDYFYHLTSSTNISWIVPLFQSVTRVTWAEGRVSTTTVHDGAGPLIAAVAWDARTGRDDGFTLSDAWLYFSQLSLHHESALSCCRRSQLPVGIYGNSSIMTSQEQRRCTRGKKEETKFVILNYKIVLHEDLWGGNLRLS